VPIAICIFVPFGRAARHQKWIARRSDKTCRPLGSEMLIAYIYLKLLVILTRIAHACGLNGQARDVVGSAADDAPVDARRTRFARIG
jgi:hypothetical protein